ncbi:hypothetical protein [Hydrogenimonas sp.]
MLEKVWMKLLLTNIVVALVSVVGFFLHVTDNASTLTKLLFYPLYAYTLISFLVSAIAIVYGALDYQKGDQAAKIGIYAHIGYIVALMIGIALVVAYR